MSESSDSYDDLPYAGGSCPASHPDNLAVVAALFGRQPATPDGARVLEIGCAEGGNLLPMAAALPGSRFVGIDLSPRQIAAAQVGAEALQLSNVMFHAANLADWDAGGEPFDYIIAHGVYSWVGAAVRDQLMAGCARWLHPEGVTFISYNTLPGSAMRDVLRAMSGFHAGGDLPVRERVGRARECFTFLEGALRDRSDGYAMAMKEELRQAREGEDFYIAHEYLEATNEPCYFHEFLSHARQHGLQFLGEAEIRTMSAAGFSAPVREALRAMAGSMEEAEQYGDFVRNRSFRQTLLCHAGAAVKRTVSPEVVQRFHLACRLDPVPGTGAAGPGEVRQFKDADGGVIGVRDPLTLAAIEAMRAVWPQSMPFDEVLAKAAERSGLPAGPEAATALARHLLTCYSSSRGMEFHFQPRPGWAGVSAFPMAPSLARWQAGQGSRITNQRHENVVLGPRESALLQRLDGSVSLASLIRESAAAGAVLEHFAQAALLKG